MMQAVKYVLFMLISLFANDMRGQFYLTGEDPSGVRWRELKSANYRVIYPVGTDSLAQRYMNLLELYRPYVMSGVMANPKSIPVVLHPYTTVSNGMVVWAPKRVELYTCPPASGGYAQTWDSQLVLHESRHVGQMNAFTTGVFKPLGWFFGEQITGLGCGIYGAKWLLEGDAVIAETELSNSGRGRSAGFMEYYRAAFLNGDFRNWYKWKFGSNKIYTPNVYSLGYMVLSAGRSMTDDYTYTGKMLKSYVKHFYNPNVLNATQKSLTGYPLRRLASAGVMYHTGLWEKDLEERGEFTAPQEFDVRRSNYYTTYENIVPLNADSIICVKKSFDAPARLVMVGADAGFNEQNRRGEKVLRYFSSYAGNFARSGNKLYYVETIGDKRWGMVAYNDLFSYDIESGKISRLTRKARYNNPSVSTTGDSLAVVEYPLTGGSNIVLLDTCGKMLCRKSAPFGGELKESAWIGDTLYALALTDRGLGIFSIVMDGTGELSGKEWRVVLKEQYSNICSLKSSDDMLYFESDADGVNNIYRLDPANMDLDRVTNAAYAAHFPAVSGGRLFYSNLGLNGNFPVYKDTLAIKRDGDLYIEGTVLKNQYKYPVAEMLAGQARAYFDKNPALPDSIVSPVEYKPERYSRLGHIFRPHSWAPFYYNVDRILNMSGGNLYDLVSLGAIVYSQNTLGTAVGMLGYSYSNGHHGAHASFEYRGWMPVFKVEADYNAENRMQYRVVDLGETKVVDVKDTGDPLFGVKLRGYLPLYFNSRGWQRGFIPQLLWKFDNSQFYSQSSGSYKFRHQLVYQLQYYQMLPVAKAAIFPRWGYNFTLSGSFSPGGAENFGSLLAAHSYFYLPGFDAKHGFKLTASYQKQFTSGKYFYLENLVSLPRGYKGSYFGDDYFRVGVDYAVPVNFNGLNLGILGYYKRLQFIPFADYARMTNGSRHTSLTSYGTDFLVDGYIFRIGVPVSVGVRYARTNEKGNENSFGLLFNVSMP